MTTSAAIEEAVEVWELINPSDAITFRATPEEAAFIADVMRRAPYFVRHAVSRADPPDLPDLQARYDRMLADDTRRNAYADAWASFAIVHPAGRATYDEEMALTHDAARTAARDLHHGRARTSLNDICAQCWAIADRVRAWKP